jgi:hypothetical protein
MKCTHNEVLTKGGAGEQGESLPWNIVLDTQMMQLKGFKEFESRCK